jgi:hypothetical protein
MHDFAEHKFDNEGGGGEDEMRVEKKEIEFLICNERFRLWFTRSKIIRTLMKSFVFGTTLNRLHLSTNKESHERGSSARNSSARKKLECLVFEKKIFYSRNRYYYLT